MRGERGVSDGYESRGEVRFVDDGRPCLTQRTLAAVSPWHLVVGVLMQNRTDRGCARPALERVFRIAPTPEDALALSGEGRGLLLEAIRSCGLQNRRLRAILEATEDYVAGRTP